MAKKQRSRAAIQMGQAIKRMREQRGWSQGQLHEYAKVGRGWLSRVEVGDIERPSASLLISVARAMRIPVKEFFEAVGLDVRDLLREQPQEFAPGIVEMAVRLQALPPNVRDSALAAFETTLNTVEGALRGEYPRRVAESPEPYQANN